MTALLLTPAAEWHEEVIGLGVVDEHPSIGHPQGPTLRWLPVGAEPATDSQAHGAKPRPWVSVAGLWSTSMDTRVPVLLMRTDLVAQARPGGRQLAESLQTGLISPSDRSSSPSNFLSRFWLHCLAPCKTFPGKQPRGTHLFWLVLGNLPDLGRYDLEAILQSGLTQALSQKQAVGVWL